MRTGWQSSDAPGTWQPAGAGGSACSSQAGSLVSAAGTAEKRLQRPALHAQPRLPRAARPAAESAALANRDWNGPITVTNSAKYVKALKDYIAADMRTLLFDYAKWNPEQAQWFNQPWLGPLREPIHGVFVGTAEFPADMFPRWVSRARWAPTSSSTTTRWRRRAFSGCGDRRGWIRFPASLPAARSSRRGSIIVKPAFTTADATLWPPMQGPHLASTRRPSVPRLRRRPRSPHAADRATAPVRHHREGLGLRAERSGSSARSSTTGQRAATIGTRWCRSE